MFDKSVLDIISDESKKLYLWSLEEKYLWNVTNIINLEKMIKEFWEVPTREEIAKIKDKQEAETAKTKFMAFEWLEKQLKDNKEALEMHKENILFIK